MKAMASISINRPVDEVFDFVTDVENMPRWVSGVSGAHLVSDVMGRGARYVIDYVAGWRSSEVEIEVVDFERPRIFANKASRGPFDYEGRMELAADGSSTSITNTIEDDPDSLASQIAAWVFGPLLRGARRRRMERELETLRSVMGSTST
ncbi:MAG: SRPBCC family protein [Acidimicrobiia bacterium]|nr:SRPBCC family protein [Acidimicrobiia bacterium]